MADAAPVLLDADPTNADARPGACRHPRVLSSPRASNVTSVHCRDCGHAWLEIHPPVTHAPKPMPRWLTPLTRLRDPM